ncbi:MAG: MBL fold metallo-hydrolase [bacterium]|nr:MBL fold metallo-hydrolase [bacterium]
MKKTATYKKISASLLVYSMLILSPMLISCGTNEKPKVDTYQLNKIKVEKVLVEDTNCYLVGDDNFVAVIDPGFEAGKIIKAIGKRKVKYILITHSHYDHISALEGLAAKYPRVPIGIHFAELNDVQDTNLDKFLAFVLGYKLEKKLVFPVLDTMKLPFGGKTIQVIHTPGHSPGSSCFLIEEYLFSGDTLFNLAIGRTDFPGGNRKSILHNIETKLFKLDEKTKVYPGHSKETTIGYEKKNNPFFFEPPDRFFL